MHIRSRRAPGGAGGGLGQTAAVMLVGLIWLLSPVGGAAATLRVVATTPDLADLVRAVGGDRVEVAAIAHGYQDPHYVEAKPSFVLMLYRADLLVVVGRELEAAWLPALIRQSRNARIQPGATGYLDASLTVKILDVPVGQITRAMGDVHPLGNPHYWLDPDNGRRMARAIRDKLVALSPEDASYFAGRFDAFDERLTAADERWRAYDEGLRGAKVVTYHRSWPNFADRFGLDVVGYVEPRPGIPPSPAHLVALIGEIRRQNVRLILVEPYFDLKTPNAIARESGARVVVLPPSVGGVEGATDYIELFDVALELLASTLESTATP